MATYLVLHPQSGNALFSELWEAKKWADYQTSYHTPDVTVVWVDGGAHGWHAQRDAATKKTFEGAASIETHVVDANTDTARHAWMDAD